MGAGVAAGHRILDGFGIPAVVHHCRWSGAAGYGRAWKLLREMVEHRISVLRRSTVIGAPAV
ncbi:hypothetical protein ACLOJK_024151, partial [Asimina triloba]